MIPISEARFEGMRGKFKSISRHADFDRSFGSLLTTCLYSNRCRRPKDLLCLVLFAAFICLYVAVALYGEKD